MVIKSPQLIAITNNLKTFEEEKSITFLYACKHSIREIQRKTENPINAKAGYGLNRTNYPNPTSKHVSNPLPATFKRYAIFPSQHKSIPKPVKFSCNFCKYSEKILPFSEQTKIFASFSATECIEDKHTSNTEALIINIFNTLTLYFQQSQSAPLLQRSA